MLENKFTKILIILLLITGVFMLWQMFSDDGPDIIIMERAIPSDNYEFLKTPIFRDLKHFHKIKPIEESGRENPFNVY